MQRVALAHRVVLAQRQFVIDALDNLGGIDVRLFLRDPERSSCHAAREVVDFNAVEVGECYLHRALVLDLLERE